VYGVASAQIARRLPTPVQGCQTRVSRSARRIAKPRQQEGARGAQKSRPPESRNGTPPPEQVKLLSLSPVENKMQPTGCRSFSARGKATDFNGPSADKAPFAAAQVLLSLVRMPTRNRTKREKQNQSGMGNKKTAGKTQNLRNQPPVGAVDGDKQIAARGISIQVRDRLFHRPNCGIDIGLIGFENRTAYCLGGSLTFRSAAGADPCCRAGQSDPAPGERRHPRRVSQATPKTDPPGRSISGPSSVLRSDGGQLFPVLRVMSSATDALYGCG